MEKIGNKPLAVYDLIGMELKGGFFAQTKKNYGETVCAGRRTRMQYLRKHKLGKFAKKQR